VELLKDWIAKESHSETRAQSDLDPPNMPD
jgi:hypothetical protein